MILRLFCRIRLEEIIAQRDKPQRIQVDNCSEFTSKSMDLWAYLNKVKLDFSRPGKPTDNALIESFNGKFRAECLNGNWFLSLADARDKIEQWRQDYNCHRPHSSLGDLASMEFAESCIPSDSHKEWTRNWVQVNKFLPICNSEKILILWCDLKAEKCFRRCQMEMWSINQ